LLNISFFVETPRGFPFPNNSVLLPDNVAVHDSEAVNEHATAIGLELLYR
jgi:hypothetical protein